MNNKKEIAVKVNGEIIRTSVESRTTLADFLREDLNLTGTHLGCEHGVCGACTILMDGSAIRSCLVFAVQADQSEIVTIEGLSDDQSLHPIQQGFIDSHGLQCGFCTSGFILSIYKILQENRGLTEEKIRELLSGNICRCTGYQNIIGLVKELDQTWDRKEVMK